MPKRTAIQKRDTAEPPRVELLTQAKGANYPPGRMLISSPLEIAQVVAAIPRGEVITMGALRQQLAQAHDADYTCPLTTGIFLRIAAEAADEEDGALPYWRVVKDDGKLLDKLPGGPEAQAQHLAAEGHAVLRKGASLRLSRTA